MWTRGTRPCMVRPGSSADPVPAPSLLRRVGRSSPRACSSSQFTVVVSCAANCAQECNVLMGSEAEGTTTPPVRWEGVTTPPIPSSSPYCAPDSMDISPLPHKAPFSFVPERSLTLTLPSPTPDTTSAGASQDDMLSPCELPPPPHFSTSQLEVPRPSSAAEFVPPYTAS
jgi:hypothetical protein